MAELMVQDGLLDQVSVEYLRNTMDNVRVMDESGSAWSGTILVDRDGAATLPEGSNPVFLKGEALLTGADLTALGFEKMLGDTGSILVTLAVILFAVSTAISWSYYGDRSVEFLFGPRAIPIYRWFFVAFFFLGCLLPLHAVWTWGDVALGLMSIPNLIALVLLTGKVREMTRDYFSREQIRPAR